MESKGQEGMFMVRQEPLEFRVGESVILNITILLKLNNPKCGSL
jgi:hypothetical protein